MQNKCLRIISDVYKVTSVRVLKIETHIVSMKVYLNQLQAQIRCRLRNDDQTQLIHSACKRIKDKLQDRTESRRDKKETSRNNK